MYGFAAGVFITILPKIIEETVPHKYYARFFGASTNVFVLSFFMFNTWMSLSIPDYDIFGKSLKKQMAKSWVLGWFNFIPVPFMICGLAATTSFFNHNPLYFLIEKGEKEHDDAMHVITQIYAHTVDHEYAEIYKCLKEGTEVDYDNHENWEHHPHLTEEEKAEAEAFLH